MLRFTTIILFGLATLSLARPAWAHAFETDGVFSAVLHVDPLDSPVAGRRSTIELELKDTSKKFSPAACTCIVHISESSREIFAKPIQPTTELSGLTSLTLTYTFPKPDTYQLQLTGQPMTAGAFQPFSLTYHIQAGRYTGSFLTNPGFWYHFFHYGFIAVFIIMFIVLFSRGRLNFQRSSRPPSSD